MFSIIISQIIKMLLLLSVGILCFRLNIIDDSANKKLANLLLMVVNPIVALTALQMDYSSSLAEGLLISYVLAIITHLIMIPVVRLLISDKIKNGKVKKGNSIRVPVDNENFAVERFSAMYSNCGFIGIPLVQSVLGGEGVLYLTAYMTVFNIFTWTHGTGLMNLNPGETTALNISSIKGKLKTALRKMLTPMIIASFLGLILFLLRIRFPSVIADTLNYIGNMNTPLAMIIVGISVAQTSIPAMLKNRRIYLVTFVKLILMPSIIFVLLMLIRVNSTIAYTILIAAACPSPATCTAFALRFKKNYNYSSELYAFTTLCSLFTVPFFVFAAERLL